MSTLEEDVHDKRNAVVNPDNGLQKTMESPNNGLQVVMVNPNNSGGTVVKNDQIIPFQNQTPSPQNPSPSSLPHDPSLSSLVQQSPSSLARVKRSPGSYHHRPGPLILNRYEFTIESGKHFTSSDSDKTASPLIQSQQIQSGQHSHQGREQGKENVSAKYASPNPGELALTIAEALKLANVGDKPTASKTAGLRKPPTSR